MPKTSLRAIVAFAAAIGSASATEPGPLWSAEPTAPDPHWSETFYPVGAGAVRARLPFPGETPQEAAALNAAWEEGIRTYLRRVSHMVAGMNLDEDGWRRAECDAMAALVHERFRHREGRRGRAPDGAGGFAERSKPQLVAACAARAFRLSGFYALHIRAIAFTPDLVQVTVCYYHDQHNDPLVKGGGHVLPNGRQAVPRVAVETMVREPGKPMTIAMHVALDSDEALIRGGCAAP